MMNQKQTAQAAIAFLNRATLKGEEVAVFLEVKKLLMGLYDGQLIAVEPKVDKDVAKPDPDYSDYPEEVERTYKVMDRAKDMAAG